jgi:hypothetical protein
MKEHRGDGEGDGLEEAVGIYHGFSNQELLGNTYLVTENCILRKQIQGHVRLSDAERKTLAAIGKQLGKQALAEVASLVKPDTILGWHRKLVAHKFDGSQQGQEPGRSMRS